MKNSLVKRLERACFRVQTQSGTLGGMHTALIRGLEVAVVAQREASSSPSGDPSGDPFGLNELLDKLRARTDDGR